MTRRSGLLRAALGLTLLWGTRAAAQTVETPPAPPRPAQWEATLFAGYRFEGSIVSRESLDRPVVELDNAATFGLALDWQVGRYADVEMQYSYTNSPATATLTNISYDMGIHDATFGFIGNFVRAGRPVRPYLGLGLGLTILVPSNELSSETKFTFALAAGVRAYLSNSFGLRLEVRWAPVSLFTTDCYWNDPPCENDGRGYVIEQTDIRLGATFRF